MSEEARRGYYEEFVARVTEANAEFDAASEGEKRMIIARDVLAHLQAGVLSPVHRYGLIGRALGSSNSIRDAIVARGVTCQACARGSIVFSTIMRSDRVKGPVVFGCAMVEEFPSGMMMDIEAAFEGQMCLAQSPTCAGRELMESWGSQLAGCAHFGQHNDTYVLTEIMRWIIDHEGEFDLIKFLEYQVEKCADALESLEREFKEVQDGKNPS